LLMEGAPLRKSTERVRTTSRTFSFISDKTNH
jgi:hypothetical protein